MKTSGNTILITGGGSGIGEALAHRLHDAGNTVIVAGRRLAPARPAAGRANMHAAPFDVADAADIRAFAERVVAAHPALNVLVNNAGIMRLEDAAEPRDLRDAEETVTTNILGPIRLTDALIGHLRDRGDGVVVNVTSGLAFLPLVDAPTYSATKAAMHSYTASLREVLRGQVEVIELVPPGVQTGLTPGQASRPGYLPLADYIDEVMANWARTPTPAEILVERVLFNRNAEREGRFDASLTEMNERARAARSAVQA